MKMQEKGKMRTEWTIHKFKDSDGEVERALKAGESITALATMYPRRFLGVERVHENCLLNEGIQYLLDAIAGIVGSPVLWDAANARVGVGSDSTTAAPAQTDLLAAVQKAYASMDATYPSRSGQTLSFRGTFGSGIAEFAWEEFIVDNGAASGKTLNRKAETKGTKGAGESWTLTVQITLS